MPIHDWTRVIAGTFHAFHHAWIAELQIALNAGLLPADYYALAEQRAGDIGPDVLALESPGGDVDFSLGWPPSNSGVAVAEAPPKVRMTETLKDVEYYLGRQKRLVVRHTSGDRIVAFIEIVSPGNKSSSKAPGAFVEKAVQSLAAGYHLLAIDLIPPGPFDPNGIHGAIRERIEEGTEERAEPYAPPPGKPLTLAAYSAGKTKTAYVEPTAVGERLIDMPLFLDPDHYVPVPLEETYLAAWRGVPQRWRRVIEGG